MHSHDEDDFKDLNSSFAKSRNYSPKVKTAFEWTLDEDAGFWLLLHCCSIQWTDWKPSLFQFN